MPKSPSGSQSYSPRCSCPTALGLKPNCLPRLINDGRELKLCLRAPRAAFAHFETKADGAAYAFGARQSALRIENRNQIPPRIETNFTFSDLKLQASWNQLCLSPLVTGLHFIDRDDITNFRSPAVVSWASKKTVASIADRFGRSGVMAVTADKLEGTFWTSGLITDHSHVAFPTELPNSNHIASSQWQSPYFAPIAFRQQCSNSASHSARAILRQSIAWADSPARSCCMIAWQ